PYGRRWTQRLSSHLSQQQFTIVSGMAAGIDTYAHQSCLHSSGQTIAVLGTGVDVAYPHSNAQLYQHILKTGLILSEYPDGTPPERSHFPRRNRIIAGLSHATLVTEAPERSGALITAYLANDYGRHVYALPAGLDNPTARGCLMLINTGAAIIMGEDHLVTDLLNIGIAHQTTAHEAQDTSNTDSNNTAAAEPASETATAPMPEVELDEALQPIFKMIPDVPITLDNLVKATQLDTSALLSGLLQLELAGVITQLPGGQYQRR
ncbi:MAG: DNA-processing protein DprA, partial [Cyanobacteria bacterium J06636_28]